MILRDSIEVCATPAQFLAFFHEMDNDRCLRWHPAVEERTVTISDTRISQGRRKGRSSRSF